MSRAVCTISPCGGTRRKRFTASAIGTCRTLKGWAIATFQPPCTLAS
jgi:hypothetical protein